MPLYTLNRTYTYRSTSGVVSFVKGEPTWVIPAMEREVAAIGAERVDGDSPEMLEPERTPLPQLSVDERNGQIFIAFDQIVERNDSKDFTGAGVPTVKAVERIVDFDVDRGEVGALWQEYRQSKVEE